MRASEQRRQRMRIDRTAVRDQAVRGSNRGSQTLIMPEGVKEWRPDKETEYYLRILPYTVTLGGHPDDREVGTLWYRRPYRIHFSVGGSDKAVVCPKSFGKPCPICQEIDNLYQSGYEKNKKVIDAIRATKYCMFAAFVEGVEGQVIFVWNESKFAEKLEKKLKKASPEDLGFADTDDGRMICLSTEMEEPGTKEFKAYLTTESISFEDAEEFTNLTDEVLDSVPELDEVLKQTPYETIAKMFHGIEDDDDTDSGKTTTVAASPATTRRLSSRKAKEPEAKEPWRKEPEAEESEAEESEAEEICCLACTGTGKNSRGRVCMACNGTGMSPAAPPAREETTKPPSATKATVAAKDDSEWDDSEW